MIEEQHISLMECMASWGPPMSKNRELLQVSGHKLNTCLAAQESGEFINFFAGEPINDLFNQVLIQ